MEWFSKMLIDFIMNGAIEIFVIGSFAYIITGLIMRSANSNLGIWFGRKGGKLLWLVVALLISSSYHWIKNLFD